MSLNYKAITDEMDKLPLPLLIEYYNVDGQRLFPIRSVVGCSTSVICYLVYNFNFDGKIAVQPIEFYLSSLGNSERIAQKLKLALIQFTKDLDMGCARLVDMNGGDLGRENDHPIRLVL